MQRKKHTQKASKSHKKEKKGVKKSGWIWSGGRSCRISAIATRSIFSASSRERDAHFASQPWTKEPWSSSSSSSSSSRRRRSRSPPHLCVGFLTPDNRNEVGHPICSNKSSPEYCKCGKLSQKRLCFLLSALWKRLTSHTCVTVKVKDAFGSLRVAFGSSGTFGPSWNFTLVQGGDASQTGLSEFPFHGSIPGGEKGLRAFSSSRTENKNTVARLAKCKS